MWPWKRNKKKTPSYPWAYRGGCAACDMRGPKRATFEEANRDANAHSERMHGGFDHNPSAYIEAVDW